MSQKEEELKELVIISALKGLRDPVQTFYSTRESFSRDILKIKEDIEVYSIDNLKDVNDVISQASFFVNNFVPIEYSLKGMKIINKKISLFGTEKILPPSIILDYGQFDCDYCCTPHQKLVFIFCEETLHVDFIFVNNKWETIPDEDFWDGAAHYWGDEEDIEQLQIEDSILSRFVGKTWSYSSKITERDGIEEKTKRFSDELYYMAYFLKHEKDSLPKGWKPQSIHFSDGWFEEEEGIIIPPFVIAYYGSVKNGYCVDSCDKTHKKYILALNGKMLYYDYCPLHNMPIYCSEKDFKKGTLVKDPLGCH